MTATSNTRITPFQLVAILVMATLFSGCGKDGSNNDATANNRNPASLKPADPDLAQTYLQSCFACHSRSLSGAPVTGDKAAWQPRLAKGMDTLVDNAINGYRGMPPLGGCMDCDRQEFADLIHFMANAEHEAPQPEATTPEASQNTPAAAPAPDSTPEPETKPAAQPSASTAVSIKLPAQHSPEPPQPATAPATPEENTETDTEATPQWRPIADPQVIIPTGSGPDAQPAPQ